MDYGWVKNLLIWTIPKHEKPVRINDTMMTIDEANNLIKLLQVAVNNQKRTNFVR